MAIGRKLRLSHVAQLLGKGRLGVRKGSRRCQCYKARARRLVVKLENGHQLSLAHHIDLIRLSASGMTSGTIPFVISRKKLKRRSGGTESSSGLG